MPVMRSYRNVLRAAHICHAFLSECLAFGSRLLFAACAPNRTACGMFRSYSAVGRDRHSCVLGCRVVIELGWFTSGLRVSLWRSRRRTKGTGERGEGKGRGNAENERDAGDGGGGAARQSAFLRKHIDFAVFSAGSALGQKVEAALRPRPRLRQRAIGSLDSLHLGRDVGAFYAARGKQVQRRLDRLAFVLRLSCVPVEMSCVRSRLLFAA